MRFNFVLARKLQFDTDVWKPPQQEREKTGQLGARCNELSHSPQQITLATNNPALATFFGLYPKIENRSSGLTGF